MVLDVSGLETRRSPSSEGVEGGGRLGLVGQGAAEVFGGEDFDVGTKGQEGLGGEVRAEAQLDPRPARLVLRCRRGTGRGGSSEVGCVDAQEHGQDLVADAGGDGEWSGDVVDAAAQGFPHLGQLQAVAAPGGLGEDGGGLGPVRAEEPGFARRGRDRTSREPGSAAVFFAGSAIAGAGFGSGFQGGIRMVVPLAAAHQRAGLVSLLYVVSYLGLGVPAVLAGFGVVHGGGLVPTTRYYGAAVIALAALALFGLLKNQLTMDKSV